VIRFPNEFKAKDPILPDSKLREAKEMAAIYPLLYVLENSIREVIKRVMKEKHGDEWWQDRLTDGKAKNVKDKAASRMKTETRNKWHQRRGSHPVDYVELEDLETIVRSNEVDFFPNVLSDKEWFRQFMRELVASRNVVCHMNPLDKTNIQDLKVKVARWNKQIGASDSKLP